MSDEAVPARTDRKTMTEVLRDARAKALFGVETYDKLRPQQKLAVDELMQRSHKYRPRSE